MYSPTIVLHVRNTRLIAKELLRAIKKVTNACLYKFVFLRLTIQNKIQL